MYKILYLDMDGVLCEFENRYKELYKIAPKEAKGSLWIKNWEHFVLTEQFKSLDWHETGKELLDNVVDTVNEYKRTVNPNFEIHVLSSTASDMFHDKISLHKTHWLVSNGLYFKRVFVPGKRHKIKYATADSLLIDDTISNVEDFVKNGAVGIHHTNVDNTIEKLKISLWSYRS